MLESIHGASLNSMRKIQRKSRALNVHPRITTISTALPRVELLALKRLLRSPSRAVFHNVSMLYMACAFVLAAVMYDVTMMTSTPLIGLSRQQLATTTTTTKFVRNNIETNLN